MEPKQPDDLIKEETVDSFGAAKELTEQLERVEAEPQAVASAIEAIRDVERELGPAAVAKLVESNVVLTLAGERGQTEFFGKSGKFSEQDAEKLNRILGPKGFRFDVTDIGDKGVMVNVECLAGYERMSKLSKIPGIKPFEATRGWDGLKVWAGEVMSGVRAAYQRGEIDIQDEDQLIDIAVGVTKGYPDAAILGYFRGDSDTKHTTIAHASEYGAAEPNYSYSVNDGDNPEIVEHVARWGKILTDFYESDYHQQLSRQPEFIAARTKL